MNYLNQAASALNSGIDAVVKYIAENGTVLALLLAAAFFIRSQSKPWRISNNTLIAMPKTTTFWQVRVLLFFATVLVKRNPSFVEAAGGGHVLAQGTIAAQNATTREEELRKARLRQQEVATERALEAAKLKAEKEAQERQRKNNVAKKTNEGGNKLGGGSNSSSQGPEGYNPMQPWSGHSSGYRWVQNKGISLNMSPCKHLHDIPCC